MLTATAEALPDLYTHGKKLDASPDQLGLMRDSSDLLDDVESLRRRMQEDGYLLLRGYLDREEVLDARREITRRLSEQALLDPRFDPMDAIASTEKQVRFHPDLAKGNAQLARVLRAGRMMQFWDRFLGGPSMCFDYTWFRSLGPGFGTPPHCDVVYMGRGTHNLFTAWTPIGRADFETGGLILLEGSNRNDRLKSTYGMFDVDSFCTNRPPESKSAKGGWAKTGGHLTTNANQLRRSVGGRWVTTEYDAGDVLLFTIFTVHASTDNRSNRIRMSSDTRYQLASEPIDQRWMGENPIAHGQAGKRGRVC